MTHCLITRARCLLTKLKTEADLMLLNATTAFEVPMHIITETSVMMMWKVVIVTLQCQININAPINVCPGGTLLGHW